MNACDLEEGNEGCMNIRILDKEEEEKEVEVMCVDTLYWRRRRKVVCIWTHVLEEEEGTVKVSTWVLVEEGVEVVCVWILVCWR